jgi:hypothetical protein
MNRRKPELQAIDIASWPTVANTEFDSAQRKAFEARRDAIMRYVRGESLKAVEKATGVNRRQLYRSLEHALAPHPDGRPFGYRGLIKHVRITDYARVKAVHIQGEGGSCGASGALSQLFERYPILADWLRLQIKQRRVMLEQIGTDGRLRTRLRGLQSLHEEFLRQCRIAGLTAADYPFNTAGRAIRSVSQRLKAEMLHSFGTAARSAGALLISRGYPRGIVKRLRSRQRVRIKWWSFRGTGWTSG